ncbi:MAG TPA: DUF4214 domain-containing protein [Pirellulales bacterium]|nr:DUF4214 domain-containing protein [Pirellulales bacterium]
MSAVPVLNANDTGTGSLRDAINQVNTVAGVDEITFNLPSSTLTVKPATPLPQITKPVTIDGTTQPGFAVGSLMVTLDGSLLTAGSGDIGLDLAGGNSTVTGLVIDGFGTQVRLTAQGGNVVRGNLLGTDVTGTQQVANGGTGVFVDNSSAGNTIGGTSATDRNVISGFDDDVLVGSAAGQGNVIEGNFIGTDITGTKSLGGGTEFGILIQNNGTTVGGPSSLAGGQLAGAGNLISGNDGDGLALFGADPSHPSDSNRIQGNFIGTDVTGTKALGNGLGPVGQQKAETRGIVLAEATNTLIGGTAAGTGNLISANSNEQVKIDGGSGNKIEGNKIGTDVTGTQNLGAEVAGVLIGFNEASSNNTVGGLDAGAGNIIEFSQRIIQVNTGIIMQSFGGYGVAVGGNANVVSGNTVAFNKTSGVFVGGGTANTISRNAIFGQQAGIVIGSANNNNQAAPALTSADTSSSGTAIEGKLTDGQGGNVPHNATFTIEFFSYPVQDPASATSQTYLGSTTTTSDAMGTAPVFLNPSTPVPAGQFVTATATDSSGNTSMFSPDIQVTSNVVATPVASFKIDVPATAVAGAPFTLKVTALDANHQPVTGYAGTVHFATTSPKFSLPGDYTFTTGPGGDDGAHTFTNALALDSVGSWIVAASDNGSGVSSQSSAVDVSPNIATHLALSIPTPASEAAPQDVLVTALDAFDNTATGYAGTIHFASADTTQLPSNYTFSTGSGGDNGSHSFARQVVFDHLGSVTVQATDVATSSIAGSETVTAGPGPAARFVITGAPATVQPFKSLVFTVTAQDALGATATGYSGRVTFSSTDGAASLGPPFGFPVNVTQNFVATDNLNLATTGVQTLKVTDQSNPSITGSTTITVAGPPFPATISGNVFQDFLLSGSPIAGSGLPGRTVFIDENGNGQLDAGEPSAVSDSAGDYTLVDVPVGSAKIREVLFPGTTVTTSPTSDGPLTVKPGEVLAGINFGNFVANTVVPLAPVLFPLISGSPQNYIRELYKALLNREADLSGLEYWLGLMNGSTAAAQAVAQGIWDSTEHRGLQVDSYYSTYLHRTADPSGHQFWVNNLIGGAGEAAVVDGFVTSKEYLSLHSTPAALHAALSLDVLGVPNAVVDGDLSSPAASASAYLEADVKRIVDSYYADFLHRPPDPLESVWLTALQGSAVADLKLESVGLSILASAECIAKFE